MRSFDEILAIAVDRKGGVANVMAGVMQPLGAAALAAIPDDRWLAAMARGIWLAEVTRAATWLPITTPPASAIAPKRAEPTTSHRFRRERSRGGPGAGAGELSVTRRRSGTGGRAVNESGAPTVAVRTR